MDRNDRWLGLVLRAGLLLLFLWTIKGELPPVVLGAIFALVLHPLAARLRRRSARLGRKAPLLLTIGVLVLGVIPVALVAGQVVLSINSFLSDGLGGAVDRVIGFVSERLAWLSHVLGLEPGRLRSGAFSLIQRFGAAVAQIAGGMATALPGQIVDVFLFLLAIYYFLRDGGRLVRFLISLSPFPEHDTDELLASVRDTVHGALVGQLATSAVQGSLTTLALFVFQVPGALLFGLLATFLSILPLVGTTPVTIGAVVYLLASGRYGAAAGMGVAAVLIGLSDNVVRPWVQSSHGGLHPLVTLLSIFGGIEVFGVSGVFLGPVIGALAVWIVSTYAAMHQRRRERATKRPRRAPPAET